MLIVLASETFALPSAPARADDRTIAIGLDLPLSGIDGASAIPVRNAVMLAVDQANRAGFPGGYTVRIDDVDDSVGGKHDPAQGAQNVRSFAGDDSVVAALGPMNSNVAEAEIPVANAAGLALISMGATATSLTEPPDALRLRPANPDRPTFFRVCAADDRAGAAAAAFAYEAGRRRAFVIDDNESYGKGVADQFAGAFARRGGTVLGREHLVPFAIDYKPLLTKVAALHPDAVFFGGIVSTGGAVLRRQMADVGLGNVPYYGGDGLESPEFVPLAGRAADGTFFTFAAPDLAHFAPAAGFVRAYRARYGQAPGSYSVLGYAAALVALAAVRGALHDHPSRAPARDEILRRIAATSGLVTPLGSIAFDRFGDVRQPVISLYRIAGGKVEFVRQSKG